jgi:hypothetical protein
MVVVVKFLNTNYTVVVPKSLNYNHFVVHWDVVLSQYDSDAFDKYTEA